MLLPAALLVTAAAPDAGPPGAAIEIAVTNVESSEGRVHIEICPERLFLKDCPYVGEAPARQGTTRVIVRNVPPGRYAAQGYHDRDGDGKADRNFLGLPTEAVGFSNNAMTRLAKPRFGDAAFDHGTSDQRITFEMKKFL
ncbi:DUF2141 domain-containing protein [Stakelama tenebrarum]|uniref:DUF2141 domain-containing protein n=1 Tax=Stakelama tenebrarum TaxID=2711215 RepID=UPI001D17F79D|nr:DUF2141 domain-containing protein [Sphingosinithalassobacter tenebrarum]